MQNPFSILALPPGFDLDEAALRRAYLAKVATIHPDLVGEDAAQAASAELNHARNLLSNPESRADILLRLNGGPAKETDKSLPPGFLMEMMETRETIESALASGNPADRTQWTTWGHQQRATYIQEIAKLFATPITPQSLQQIRTTLNAWRYIERLIEQLDPAYDPNQSDFKN